MTHRKSCWCHTHCQELLIERKKKSKFHQLIELIFFTLLTFKTEEEECVTMLVAWNGLIKTSFPWINFFAKERKPPKSWPIRRPKYFATLKGLYIYIWRKYPWSSVVFVVRLLSIILDFVRHCQIQSLNPKKKTIGSLGYRLIRINPQNHHV